ncbi:MAG TPA: aminotransferase class I/II-fold pyridoxal phosphate-dependent enzyme [Candidatus Merdenecus merdavium]|nr:aminotransferase class I/II-fold pyridoxal phosphate-dependent enzyme [Candidatus Merdenecus merdavium]
MSSKKTHFHGSDIEKVEKVFGIKKDHIVNFSTNVNPLGFSPLMRKELVNHIDVITSYPDREYSSLRSAIANYTGSVQDHIFVGNGSTELISLFLQTAKPKKAIILGPTYSEYEREISLGGGSFSYFFLKEKDHFVLQTDLLIEELKAHVDLLVMCNPNNPTSSSIDQNDMRLILDVCQQRDIHVIVDETYVEFTHERDEISCVPLTKEYPQLIIIRGVSKFFASPGLRLGYAITSNLNLMKTMETLRNPWSVNSLADLAGTIMFSDKEFIQDTKRYIIRERNRMVEALSKLQNIKVYKPTANFILFKILKDSITSQDVFQHCIQNSFLVRDCSSFESLGERFIRFCVLKEEDNSRLLHCLTEILQ